MKTSHTPGPWIIRKGDEWTHDVVTQHGDLPDGSPSCWTVASANGLRDEVKENARLIAAAPDLLEACYSAMKDLMYVSQKFDVALRSFGQLDAAYRKATGEAISKQEG